MPVEIRELVIRAEVAETAKSQEQLEGLIRKLREEILEACAEMIREQIREDSER
jgi:cell division protein FtsB